ncbi:hypothetical protein [Lactobacillus phage Semele]|jgi:prefoldin subunit 5|uniref:Uncharacterized protein n=2 Tax=Harbinvirus TaxID=2732970 RepID=A0A2K9VDB7_9CAUD|nr:hypothetical protein HOS78_gp167 [Lactobacillus phage Bacchae]YP_009798508.1 hypothetical protein HOS80_gp163 [Lactobacillus phage Semele]AUV59923.1 hypothetical protein [Lactobacillus phage Bacchae]AUV60189.1 hypothetical protein [Lactobacillus phage Semele]
MKAMNKEPFASNQEMYDRINYLEQRVEELEEENEALNNELEDAYETIDVMEEYEYYDEETHD